jgi:hypothetical protein
MLDLSDSRRHNGTTLPGDENMKQILTAQVGADGVLTLKLPLGEADANKVVCVTVETVESVVPRRPMSGEEWVQFIENTAGKWVGELERPPQGEYEEREE